MAVTNRNTDGRLLIVANRLPVDIIQTDDGEFNYTISSGGLVSALQGLSKSMDSNGSTGLVLRYTEMIGI